jgi:hypothetical protein
MEQNIANSEFSGSSSGSTLIGQLNVSGGATVNFGERSIMWWLSPLNFFRIHDDISNRRQEGTGQWLLESDEFKEWVSSSGKSILCQGIRTTYSKMPSYVTAANRLNIAGAGKTILAYEPLPPSTILQEKRLIRAHVKQVYCGRPPPQTIRE